MHKKIHNKPKKSKDLTDFIFYDNIYQYRLLAKANKMETPLRLYFFTYVLAKDNKYI